MRINKIEIDGTTRTVLTNGGRGVVGIESNNPTRFGNPVRSFFVDCADCPGVPVRAVSLRQSAIDHLIRGGSVVTAGSRYKIPKSA